VDLDVARERFGQMLEQLRTVSVLGVDQQVIFIRQWLPGPGIDRLWPPDDLGLVSWPTMLCGCLRKC
jgi:hypothetical protein